MGKIIKDALNDRQIKSLKPKEKSYRKTDGDGLYLQIDSNGSKRWFLSFRLDGVRDRLAYGKYPDTGLADARDKRYHDRKLIAQGIHPRKKLQEELKEKQLNSVLSVYNVSKEWHTANLHRWSEKHAEKVWTKIEQNIFPVLKEQSVKDVKPKDIVEILRRIESRKAFDVAERVKQFLANIFRLAVHNEYIEFNPAGDMKGVLTPHKTTHRPALELTELPEFFRRLKAYELRGKRLTILAIRLLMHTFVRNKELRFIKAEDIDTKWKYATITEGKMNRKYIVPLNNQAMVIVEELIELCGGEGYLFPSARSLGKPMSDGTINKALRLMGYDTKTEVTTHGFRTTASSALNESSLWNRDAIERQMDHEEENKVRGAYTHKARYFKERKEMLIWWGNYLEGIETGKIEPMKDMFEGFAA